MSIESTNERSKPGPPASRTTTGPVQICRLALLLAALLALTLALASRAEAYIYWVGEHGEPGTIEQANPTIGRANLDGSGVKHDFIVLPLRSAVGGVAPDDAHLYWANAATDTPIGSIGRANLDGTAPNHSFIAAVEVAYGSGVAVDDKHVYWVSRFDDGSGFNPGTGAIGRAHLDGTGVDETFITGLDFPAGALAVDRSHLYWASWSPDTNFAGGLYIFPSRIGRANLDGTGVEESFITDAFGVSGLAVDDTHLWWAYSERFTGGIVRTNLDGTGRETVIGGGEDFFPCGVAVSSTHLYWTGGYFTAGGSIGRAHLDGSRPSHELITGVGDILPCPVAVDALGPPPLNDFSFGKVKKNKRKGTAKLTVVVPGPGELDLAKTKKVKSDQGTAEAAGNERLSVKARGKKKKELNRGGKAAKVKAKVTYTPDGGEPNTETKSLKLIKRG